MSRTLTGVGGGEVFVRMLGSLRRFALGGPSSLFLASLPPAAPPQLTQLGSV